jgi:transcriptional regulator with XRE-family HTH domain
MDAKNIVKRIHFILSEKGFTQRQFAGQLGISQAAVSKYLSGRVPPAEVLLKIAKMGNTSMEWILTGEMAYKSSTTNFGVVSDKKNEYGAHHTLAQKIKALPPDTRFALQTLVERLYPKSEPFLPE